MRLSNIALAITAIYGGFSPANLFAGGVAGAWYDPSDLSTMFDSSTGTTPVAMPGLGAPVPVGAMLDKRAPAYSVSFTRSPSSYLTVPNTDSRFAYGTSAFTIEAWVYLTALPSGNTYPQAYWVYGGGQVSSLVGIDFYVGSTQIAFNLENFSSPTVIGTHGMTTATWYHVAVVRGGPSNQTVSLYVNGTRVATASSVTATADPCLTGVAVSAAEPSGATQGNFQGYISNFRAVKGTAVYDPTQSTLTVPAAPLSPISGTSLLTCGTTWSGNPSITTAGDARVDGLNPFTASPVGNHAIAFNNTTARPELRARVNLLLYSEQLNNTTVQRNYGTVTANAGISPSGANNAFLFAGAGGTAGWDSYPTDYGLNGGVTQIFSVYAKAGTTGNIRISIGGAYVDFNVSTGQKVSEAGVTGSITPVGNGWYRLTGTTVKANVYHYWQIYLDNAGATSNNAFLWGTQLINANAFPANTYQRIADANTYDTSGFPLYLRFDGIDDSMYTPANLNLSGTDKVAVFAGVRKLSTAFGTICETGAGSASGSFALFSNYVADDFAQDIRGSGAALRRYVTYAAPITNVYSNAITSAFADSAAAQSCRINGIANAGSALASAVSTGNFDSRILNIGARNNSSLWLNGQIYGLLVVGSAVSAGNISATEQWVAGKTGIQI